MSTPPVININWNSDYNITQVGDKGKVSTRTSVRQLAWAWGGTGFGLGCLVKIVLSLFN